MKARVQSAGRQGEEVVRGGECPARVRATEQELKMVWEKEWSSVIPLGGGGGGGGGA